MHVKYNYKCGTIQICLVGRNVSDEGIVKLSEHRVTYNFSLHITTT